VLVEDQSFVKAGDVLVRIDPKDFEVAVAKAEADLAEAESSLVGSRADVPIISTNTASQLKTARSTRADAEAAVQGARRQLEAAQARLESMKAQVREAAANFASALDDVARYKQLVDKDEILGRYETSHDVRRGQATLVRARPRSRAEQNIRVAQRRERRV
jgi:membrane fusion protein (multidrug efflux system)